MADPLYLCFFPVFSAGLSFWFFCEALDPEFVKVEREREKQVLCVFSTKKMESMMMTRKK